jgi:hypothetical protein
MGRGDAPSACSATELRLDMVAKTATLARFDVAVDWDQA